MAGGCSAGPENVAQGQPRPPPAPPVPSPWPWRGSSAAKLRLRLRLRPPAAAPQAPRVQPGYEPVLRSSLAAAAEPAPALLGGPPAKPLPTSIYGQAAPTPPPAPQAFAQASPAPRPGGSQLYSLHREYGMTPDAIPAPPAGDNFILVGPPDTPETSDDGEDPAQGLDRQF